MRVAVIFFGVARAYALEKAQCGVCRLPVRARRVRAHGFIKREDFSESLIDLPLNPRRFRLQSRRVRFLEDEPILLDG